MTIPSSWLDAVKVERIIWHWTAGSYTASALDREHYHLLIEGDGKLIQGKHPIASVVPPLHSGKYAAHTLNLNSWSLGCAVCCMAGATENPFDPGLYPLTSEQYAAMLQVSAELCLLYKIPVTKNTLLTHAEVEANLGVKQKRKWDITVTPSRSIGKPTKMSASAWGSAFRTSVEGELEQLRNTTQTTAPKSYPPAWIRTANGSVFLVEAGWTWEEVEKEKVKENTYPLPAGYGI